MLVEHLQNFCCTVMTGDISFSNFVLWWCYYFTDYLLSCQNQTWLSWITVITALSLG